MRRLGVCLLALLLAGCGAGSDDAKVDSGEAPDPNANVIPWAEGTKTTGGVAEVKLEGVTEIKLAELLNLPRSELATRTEECLSSIQYFQQRHNDGRLPFLLLPGAFAASATPLFRQATFSVQAGFSLPPYYSGERKDSELALHLARFGDVEAARKLVDPADQDAVGQVEKLQLERNYPLEWTRLVGLLLYRTQYHVLTGNVDEVKQLIGLHQQLDQLLGPKARASGLGVELLSRGQSLLRQAVVAWRANKQDSLADQAERFASAWGEIASAKLPWQPALPRARAERVFDAKSTGKALFATAPLRVLDLLGLPIPDYGLEAVVGTFDTSDHLVETLLLFRTREDAYYPGPEALTQLLLENLHQAGNQLARAEKGTTWQTVALEGAALEAGVVANNPAVSAIVRLRVSGKEETAQPSGNYLPRGLGVVDLDRSYEQIRRRVALHQRNDQITVTARQALEQVHCLLTALPLTSFTMERARGSDVLARVKLQFNPRQKERASLASLAGPLWTLAGQARLGVGKGTRPLLLAWQDEQTAYVLRLPNNKEEKPSLDVYTHAKTDGPEASSEWVDRVETNVATLAARVQQRERDERRARITAGTPWMRLPREREGIRLGMTRSEVEQVLPPEFKAQRRATPNGIVVTFLEAPAHSPVAVAREYYALFDASGRVGEIRVRYQAGSGGAGLAALLSDLEKRGGASEKAPGPWTQTWNDLSPRKPSPLLRRWQDDVTLLTCQQDVAGVELRLRDCPLDHEEGAPLPPLAYLPRGPEGCLLGTTRDALLKQRKTSPQTMADGTLVLPAKAGSPYDALLVWFKDDRVTKIIARHAAKNGLEAGQAAAAIQTAWGKEARSLGLPWRQDVAEGSLQSWTTQDDQTRVRLFWQQRNSDGKRLVYTEWRDLAH
jgi:hypothetical protein